MTPSDVGFVVSLVVGKESSVSHSTNSDASTFSTHRARVALPSSRWFKCPSSLLAAVLLRQTFPTTVHTRNH